MFLKEGYLPFSNAATCPEDVPVTANKNVLYISHVIVYHTLAIKYHCFLSNSRTMPIYRRVVGIGCVYIFYLFP